MANTKYSLDTNDLKKWQLSIENTVYTASNKALKAAADSLCSSHKENMVKVRGNDFKKTRFYQGYKVYKPARSSKLVGKSTVYEVKPTSRYRKSGTGGMVDITDFIHNGTLLGRNSKTMPDTDSLKGKKLARAFKSLKRKPWASTYGQAATQYTYIDTTQQRKMDEKLQTAFDKEIQRKLGGK